MITASDAVLATAGFFGFGVARFDTNRSSPLVEIDTDHPASPDQLSPGEPAFEAVAEALRRTGYLDS